MTAPQPTASEPRLAGLTGQQRSAVERREVSVILSSGAGCGKTHVLTERYLSHLRDDRAEVHQIVAITFTDRAARQMRDRIRRAVLQELRTASSAEDVERWSRHLRGLETAPISTIHAFCGTLLRQHAIDAGLDPQFDVLDEVLAANLRAEAFSECFQELLTATTVPGDDLRELVLLYGWRPVVNAVEELADKADPPAWEEWLGRPPEEVVQQWLDEDRPALLPRYVAYMVAAAPPIARCLSLLRNTPCLKPQTQAMVRQVLDETPRLAEAPDLAAAVEALLDTARVSNSRERASAWPTEEDYEAVKGALEGFRRDLKDRMALFLEEPDGLTDAVTVGQRFLRVAVEAVRAYQRRKRRAGVLDFQDLLMQARDLLRRRGDLREALQRRYRFLLVDELQDTDPVQMEVVEHLCGGGLTAGKLFGVGDFKQSIYRFRGADVHLFQRLRQRMAHDGRLGLSVNFRSQPALLDFVNALFARRIADYEPLQAHHRQVNPGPCVEFLWCPRLEKENVGEGRQREAELLARRIRAMVGREALVSESAEDGTRVLRPVRPGDVVLLFRSMSHVALYEAALRGQGLDYYLVGGRAFFAQQEVYDVLNLLRALENPQDAVSLAGTLRSPFCGLSDEALFLLGRGREGLWAGLHDDALLAELPDGDRSAAARARRHLDAWRALKDRLPIAGLLGRVLADSGYDAALQFEHLGERKLANLWKLLDLARHFDRSGQFGLADFIARLGDLVARQPREEQAATQPENADVVRLMTIHQAKGLEFPVVFVPDLAGRFGSAFAPVAPWDARLGCVARPPADEEPQPFPDLGHRLWKAREQVDDWNEDLRTLYVACTRAQDYLVLSASLAASLLPETTWMLALAERFDLGTGTCRADDVAPERRPQVRVVDPFALLSPVPAVAPAPARAPLVGSGEAAAEPVPVSLQGKRIFLVSEVERLLARPKRRRAAELRPEDVAIPFDTEDGADARSWGPIGAAEDGVASLARMVLPLWDFRDPQGWRPLLAALVNREEREEVRELRRPTEAVLAAFAVSSVGAALAEATVCRRDLEFLLDVRGGTELFEAAEPVTVRGALDLVWDDRTGGRHVLVFADRAPAAGRRQPSVPLALSLGVAALQRQADAPVLEAIVYHLLTGETFCFSPEGLAIEPTLRAVREVVREVRGRQLL